MDQFVVSARKYRPVTFDTVVGQSSVTNTLINAIQNNHLAQAFLFCGPRGVGKTTCARILAKAVNAEDLSKLDEIEDDPLNIFELDAASNNSVEDIRNLIDQVRIAPQAGKQFKVYIIDEVHMLSQAAFNAFLKTLEEPPSYAIFILATTEKHKILPTILSRCQIFDFHRIRIQDMANHLHGIATKEGIEAEPDALHLIAQKADGALRDALSIFDQMVSFSGKQITYQNVIDNLNILDYDYYFKVADAILAGKISDVLLIFDDILDKGFDGHNFIAGLAEHFRNLLVCQDQVTLKLLEVGENIRAKYAEQAQSWSAVLLLMGLDLISKADVQYKASKNQRLLVEITLMQLCSMDAEKKNGQPERIIRSRSADNEAEKPTSLPVNQAPTTQTATATPAADAPKPAATPTAVAPRPPASAPLPSAPPPNMGDYKSQEPSIKEMLRRHQNPQPQTEEKPKEQQAENAEPEIITPSSSDESFSKELLLKVWNAYIEKADKDNRIAWATILKSKTPEIKDNFQLEIVLTQEVEEMELNTHRTDLLDYLRKTLNNRAIQLSYKIEKGETKKLLYTNREKFDHLAAQNPNLQTLKQKLDLDL